MKPCSADELAGGEPEENAQVIMSVLQGDQQGGARSAVLLNAGAVIYVSGAADTLEASVKLAEQTLDEGKALEALELLRTATRAP
jgi:anthranilate phosphoribosyltransferase